MVVSIVGMQEFKISGTLRIPLPKDTAWRQTVTSFMIPVITIHDVCSDLHKTDKGPYRQLEVFEPDVPRG